MKKMRYLIISEIARIIGEYDGNYVDNEVIIDISAYMKREIFIKNNGILTVNIYEWICKNSTILSEAMNVKLIIIENKEAKRICDMKGPSYTKKWLNILL